MTTNQEFERTVRSWLQPGLTTLTDDVLDAVIDQLPATPQRRPMWSRPRASTMGSSAKLLLATAAVIAVAVVGFGLASGRGLPNPGVGATSPSPLASPSPRTAPSPDRLPPLRLPGTRASPAGVYGWEGVDGYRTGMHKVRDGESADLVFAVGPECLAPSQAQRAQPVQVGDLTGVVVEPHEPPVTFAGTDGTAAEGTITRAYRLDVGDRTLCVFLTRHPTTTEAGWATALGAIDTLRATQIEQRVRVWFTLDEGWDVG